MKIIVDEFPSQCGDCILYKLCLEDNNCKYTGDRCDKLLTFDDFMTDRCSPQKCDIIDAEKIGGVPIQLL